MVDAVYDWFARRTLTQKLYLLFSFPVLFLILGTTISVLTFQAVGSTIVLAQKSDAIRSQVNTFLKSLYINENATRGYFLTGAEYLLPSMIKSMDDLALAAHDLVALVQDSPSQAQRKRAAKIEEISLRHIQDIERILAAGSPGSMARGADFVASIQDQGRDFTIATLLNAFDDEATKIQQERQDALEARRGTLLLVTLGGAVAILLSTGLGVMVVRKTVTEPMAALTRVSAQIGVAHESSILESDRPDEVGDLSRSIVAMDRQIRFQVDRLIQSEADMRRLNADLQAAERRYRSLIEQAPLGIFSTSGRTWTFVNRVQRELMGLPDEATPSFDRWCETLHPDDRGRVTAAMLDAMASGHPFEDAFRFRWPNGTVRHVLCRGVALDDQTQGPSIVWINLDVTQIEELQQRLAPAERLAAMTRMATSIAHDLRTPLLGIERGLHRLHITAGRHLGPDGSKLLGDIWVGSRLALGIVQDILDLYRHTYGPLALSYSRFDLRTMVREVVDLMAVEIEERRLAVRVIGPGLEVHADRRRLARVVLNLLENAVKNSSHGTRIWIRLSCREEHGGQHAVVAIEDEGRGVHSTTLSRLSDEHRTSFPPTQDGTGLGLYLCRIILDAHHGTIRAENREGGGARFRLEIPVHPASETEHADSATDRRRPAPL